ncbi:DUF1956 domain-containing protein [Massilia arenosa]|uniref:DUF1956 domain-containing protein n=1 Tax=Zemynaea arenosa TaxID=2561931 RepID=A0A4Y9S6U0_9BURK|nr:CerR family C-terminal domain-containing protein [Massilia arenosa]TFW17211.1 DUF1956 domain-containing protein [Massilia arenosa]
MEKDKYTTRIRSDGAQSRERLLLAAMKLFAERGFASVSTREIALAAGANVAAISYYFGDKAGLYRAAFREYDPNTPEAFAAWTRPDATLREALAAFYGQVLAPLKQGDIARLCMRLWFREVLEPTGLWHEEIENDIRPAFAGLVAVLLRHLNLKKSDDDIDRLAFCLVGQAMHMMVGLDVIEKITPRLLGSDAAIDSWIARMVDFGEGMVKTEQARRKAAMKKTA